MCAPERRQRGLSLIELMVGITVGLLITLVAIGSAQLFMVRQRQSVDVGSASGNAMTGMAAISYEVAHAGNGFYADGAPLCPRLNLSVGALKIASNLAVMPLQVTLDGDATTLDAIYGSVLEAAAPAALGGAAGTGSTALTIASYLPVAAGQQVMLVPAAGTDLPCTVRTATGVVAPTKDTQQAIALAATGINNQAAFDAVGYTAADFLSQLGTLQWARFRLVGTDLLMDRPLLPAAKSVALAHHVMAFRVQYGVVSAGSSALAWQPPTGAWTTLDAAHLPLVRALRVGLVVRTDLPEKKDAGGQCSNTTDMPMLFGQTVVLTDPDWTCYRYRAQTVVVPLRNLIMGSAS